MAKIVNLSGNMENIADELAECLCYAKAVAPSNPYDNTIINEAERKSLDALIYYTAETRSVSDILVIECMKVEFNISGVEKLQASKYMDAIRYLVDFSEKLN